MKRLTANGERFKFDGVDFPIRSGAIHYFRIMPEYWEDRLIKLFNCGFNTVETYVPWNIHEPEEGEFCFDGLCNVEEFIKTAGRIGLKVIVRAAPYICSEWDFGGLPYWLHKYPELKIRCSDSLYLEKIDKYYSVLLPKLKPLLSQNGGPIIAMALENEYGSYGNDKIYLEALKQLLLKYGMDTFFFTCDGSGPTMLDGGTLDGISAFVNFGLGDREKAYAELDKLRPGGPKMCMEYYICNHTHWGEGNTDGKTEESVKELTEFFADGESFNIYMFHGGTNFGFYNGCLNTGKLDVSATKYWNDGALLNENGEKTRVYNELKAAIKDIAPVDVLPEKKIPIKSYGEIRLTESAELFDNLNVLSSPHSSPTVKTFEELGTDYGYMLYRISLPAVAPGQEVGAIELNDRAQYYIDGEFMGIQESTGFRNDKIIVPRERVCNTLDILVENLGRVNHGMRMGDKKGITKGVYLNGWRGLFNYEIYPLSLKSLEGIKFESGFKASNRPMFYRGSFTADTVADTFLDISGFTKGVVFVNGFNLGKYWNVGPVLDLYLPAPILKKGKNEIVVFETDRANDGVIYSKSQRTVKE